VARSAQALKPSKWPSRPACSLIMEAPVAMRLAQSIILAGSAPNYVP